MRCWPSVQCPMPSGRCTQCAVKVARDKPTAQCRKQQRVKSSLGSECAAVEGVQCVMRGDDPAKIGRRSEGLCQPSLGQGEGGGGGELWYLLFCSNCLEQNSANIFAISIKCKSRIQCCTEPSDIFNVTGYIWVQCWDIAPYGRMADTWETSSIEFPGQKVAREQEVAPPCITQAAKRHQAGDLSTAEQTGGRSTPPSVEWRKAASKSSPPSPVKVASTRVTGTLVSLMHKLRRRM